MRRAIHLSEREISILEAARAALIRHLGQMLSVKDLRFTRASIFLEEGRGKKVGEDKTLTVNGSMACTGFSDIAVVAVFEEKSSYITFEATGVPFAKVEVEYPAILSRQ